MSIIAGLANTDVFRWHDHFAFALMIGVLVASHVPAAEPAAVGENRATPVARIKVSPGFQVELLYSVPPDEQGSWINLCTDQHGRILVSDQYGGLFRFPPPAAGTTLDPQAIEKVPPNIRAVNGMAWMLDALYVTVNDYDKKMENGLYRLTDSDGDDRLDRLDRVELLRAMDARGDHGVHAVVPAPDGQSLYLITGNATKPIVARSRVPACWGEDHLLPSLPDGRFRQRDVLAPAGAIYRVSPDGHDFEIVSTGYRNVFDAAINRGGELFTFDSDDEGDFNTSWYRPTRICHVVSGSEWGWRNGGGKRPPWYPDNLPPVIDVGPGSPTGMTFGYGANFPSKYQEALFVLDWSWGKLYALHLRSSGATYVAEKEEFLSGAPLPLTDAIIHPGDGAMYFTIGGRKIQSGLYRVTYIGRKSSALSSFSSADDANRILRRRLEAFHGVPNHEAIPTAWPYLDDPDRFIRWAARTAIEHQPVHAWADRSLAEPNPAKQVTALLALARAAGIDPQHRKPFDPPVNTELGSRILAALEMVDWSRLDHDQRLALLRAIQITLVRFDPPNSAHSQRLRDKLDPLFPAHDFPLDWLLCETLVYLQSPTIAEKGVAAIAAAASQEEQLEYARSLRMLTAGWTRQTRTAYFLWLLKAASSYRGGASFEKFIEFIRADAVATLTAGETFALKDVLAEEPVRISPLDGLSALFDGRTRTEWTVDELAKAAESAVHRASRENGRKIFGAAACFACHRFGNEGGMSGPDLTSAGRRYSPRDLLDQIINPSKDVNEQYVPLKILTNDGEMIVGTVVNLKEGAIEVNTDPTDPSRRTTIARKAIANLAPSKLSPMPADLLAPLTREEILDLLAYVLNSESPRQAPH